MHAIGTRFGIGVRADYTVGAGATASISADAEIGWREAAQIDATRLRDAGHHRRRTVAECIDPRTGLAQASSLVHNQEWWERLLGGLLLCEHGHRRFAIRRAASERH